MKRTLMSPDDYVKTRIVTSPSLYAGKGATYAGAKLRIFDQLFNVIGNGIRDDEELFDELSIKNNRASEYSVKFFQQDLWYTYDNCEKFGVCLDEDKDKHVLINTTRDLGNEPLKANSRGHLPWVPYPNFKEDYSIVYQAEHFNELPREWFDAAIFFYEEAENFFRTRSDQYHYAFPRSNASNEFIISEQLKHFGTRTNEEISKDWNYPYDGDVSALLKGRWLKELDRIRMFIKQTIMILRKLHE